MSKCKTCEIDWSRWINLILEHGQQQLQIKRLNEEIEKMNNKINYLTKENIEFKKGVG